MYAFLKFTICFIVNIAFVILLSIIFDREISQNKKTKLEERMTTKEYVHMIYSVYILKMFGHVFNMFL